VLEDIYWHPSKRIIIQSYSGLVSLEDIYQAKARTLDMIRAEEGINSLHIVVDTIKREGYSPEVLKLPTIRQIFTEENIGVRLGWLIVVNPSPHPIMRFLIIAAARITNNKLKITPNLDKALAFLYQDDKTLSTGDLR
jgi:hypothetical protein